MYSCMYIYYMLKRSFHNDDDDDKKNYKTIIEKGQKVVC